VSTDPLVEEGSVAVRGGRPVDEVADVVDDAGEVALLA
jgi:hypothetical protein